MGSTLVWRSRSRPGGDGAVKSRELAETRLAGAVLLERIIGELAEFVARFAQGLLPGTLRAEFFEEPRGECLLLLGGGACVLR